MRHHPALERLGPRRGRSGGGRAGARAPGGGRDHASGRGPRVSMFLDPSPLVRAEPPRRSDVPIAGAMADLAARLPYLRPDTDADLAPRPPGESRGRPPGALRLADFAVRFDAADGRVRLFRCSALDRSRTRDGIPMDPVDRRWSRGSIAALAVHRCGPPSSRPRSAVPWRTASSPTPRSTRRNSSGEGGRPPSALPWRWPWSTSIVRPSSLRLNGAALRLLASAEESRT